MQTDYKFWYITREDDVHISKVAIRFFEGDVTTKDEKDKDDKTVSVTRYRRDKRLKKEDLTHLSGDFEKESSGDDVKIYTSDDFGTIKTDDELRCFLNKELAKDKVRTVNDAQKEIDLEKIKTLKIK